MKFFTVYGVEHVYDAFDVYEHPNDVPPFNIWAHDSDAALAKGQTILQHLITEKRRTGGFLSSGDFTGEVVLIVSQDGDVAFKGREEHTYIFGGTPETYSLKPALFPSTGNPIPIIDGLSNPDFQVSLEAVAGSPGILLIPQDIRLIRHLCRQPEDIFRLSAREFEELTAEVLREFGYSTYLSPVGPDCGVDILAERECEVGLELLVVQCKRWALQRSVSRPLVQQLSAVVRDQQASRGLLVTTSFFSGPALEYMDQRRYVLSGADNTKLFQWLDRIRQRE